LFHGTPVLGKDKPWWVISNLTETKSDADDTVVTRFIDTVRHLGELLFLDCDEEACYWGWDVTQRRCGLSRTYRDRRFDLRPAALRHDPPDGGSLCRPGARSGQTTRA